MYSLKTCELCLHWRPSGVRDRKGECHANAPSPVVFAQLPLGVRERSLTAYWPETDHDDSCGEWQQRPEEGGPSVEVREVA